MNASPLRSEDIQRGKQQLLIIQESITFDIVQHPALVTRVEPEAHLLAVVGPCCKSILLDTLHKTAEIWHQAPSNAAKSCCWSSDLTRVELKSFFRKNKY